MIYLLDTSAMGDLMRDRGAIRSRFASVSPTDQVVTYAIVRGEVLHGVERMADGKRRRDLQQQAADLFAIIPSEPVTALAADQYAHIKVRRQRAGIPMDENDLWIAATALALGATLVTRDTDFANVPGLAVDDWTR